jgi:DNA-binding transcriptional LysR family regulator
MRRRRVAAIGGEFDLDIGVAQAFLEVVRTGSFVGAAESLHLTQTAVSARIRVLEEQLDRPVFVRNKTGTRLTPAGEQFLPFATSLVQVWDRARRAAALAPEHDSVVTIGAEPRLAIPLMTRWLLWMRRECPRIGITVEIDASDRLLKRVQEGALDVAVLYAAPPRTGVVGELLFEERLVMVRAVRPGDAPAVDEHVRVEWGDAFAASWQAAFPDQPRPTVSISHGPLALDYLLAAGGCGYFRLGFVQPYIDAGRVELVPDSPEFSYSAQVVHSARADPGLIAQVRAGLRAAVEAANIVPGLGDAPGD